MYVGGGVESMMMGKLKIGLMLFTLSFVLLLIACTESHDVDTTILDTEEQNEEEIITIRAWTKGAELTRITNLEEAAEELTETLNQQGEKVLLKVEGYTFEGSWEEYRKQFVMEFESGNGPDIYTIGHDAIPWLAKGNYIQPVDEIKTSEAYSDVYDTLWQAVTWQGQTWGALQDTEARPVFVNVEILRQLGWTDQEIEELPLKVLKGDFTIGDMMNVAEEAVNRGLSTYGIIHRPLNGPDFYMLAKGFGAELYDPLEDKFVYDGDGLLKTLQYFEQLVSRGLAPDELTDMSSEEVHQLSIQGDTLFYHGGIWNVFNYVEQGADYNEMLEQFDFMLVPAAEKGGKPLTLSRPLIYTLSSQTKERELCIQLLEQVASPKYQAKHAIETSHLPINRSTAQLEEFKADEYLSSIAYTLDYTTLLPKNENYLVFSEALYEAVKSVEIGSQSAEEALENMKSNLIGQLGDDIIIK